MSNTPTYQLPKYRKGTKVTLIATRQETQVEKIHYDANYGHFYKLKDVTGALGEHEIKLTQ